MSPVELHADFNDLLFELSSAGARFLLIGGWALALHGHGRGTDDLDLLVRADPENAERVWRALLAFGAPVAAHEVGPELFASEGYGYRMGLPPHRVEILTRVSGIDFDAAWEGHIMVRIAEVDVPVIGRSALITNKRAAGRPKDLADVAWLSENPSALEDS